MNKKKILLLAISLLIALSVAFGVSYAFFSFKFSGNDDAKDMITTTATLKIDFTDGKEIVLDRAYPGDSVTKTFTVKNTGTAKVYYKINWQSFTNTIMNDELTLKLTCTSTSGTCSGVTEEAVYNRVIKDNIELNPDETQTYTLTITFVNSSQNQNENQGKSFSGVLKIEESTPRWDKECKNNNSLRCKIVTDNTATSDKDINFAKISSPTNGQGLYIDDQLGDSENYYFRGGSFCAYTGYESEDLKGTKCIAAGGTWSNYKCSLDLSKETCESKNFTWYELKNNVKFGNYYWKIIRIDENGDVRLLYNGNSTTSLGSSSIIGTAQYNALVGDNAYVGYMQPEAPTEYISSVSNNRTWWNSSNSTKIKMSKTYSFDKTTGRYTLTGDIIDGSYTDTYLGYYTCSSETTTSNCSYLTQLVETTYDTENNANRILKAKIVSAHFTTTKKQASSNTIDSPIKSKNESWFKTNMTSLLDKISTNAGYCNDRTTTTKDGGVGNKETYFSSYTRNGTNKKPSLKCKNESNDLFTTTSVDYGNNKLTQPVGLITSDEVAYAGNVLYQYNYRNYLHGGYAYWTISSQYFTGGVAISNDINIVGNFTDNNVNIGYGVRPVVSINSKSLVTSGDGSLSNPYIIG